MILPTLMKTVCAACSCTPLVEVWDGNVKDTVKVSDADMNKVKGQLIQMAVDAGELSSDGVRDSASDTDADDEGDGGDVGGEESQQPCWDELVQQPGLSARAGKAPVFR